MSSKQNRLRLSIILGWVGLLQLRVVLFIIALMRGAIENDFKSFAEDPGYLGMNIMIVIFTIYVFIPIFVQLWARPFFKWFLFGVSVFFLLFFVAHELTHLHNDAVYMSLEKLLDLSHIVILFWVVACTLQWARIPRNQAGQCEMEA